MSMIQDECDSDARRLKLKFLRRVKESDGNETLIEEEVFSSVVTGCDGIRSAVRASKLGEEIAPLRYLDCIVILGIGTSPDNSELTDGKTVFQTADGVTRLYAMPFAEPGEEVRGLETVNERGLSMWQLSFPMEEVDAIELSQLGPAALKAEALRRCGAWHDPIPRLLKSTSECLVTGYPCYDRALVDKESLRVGHNKSRLANKYVTLLGDGAHPMSPFKGQGANQTLLDAVLLAQKLYSAVRKNDKTEGTNLFDDIPNALAEFEDEMLRRSAVKVKKSADAAKFLHSEVAMAEGNVTRGAAAAAGVEDDNEEEVQKF
jgi:salicylate hydroxylase